MVDEKADRIWKMSFLSIKFCKFSTSCENKVKSCNEQIQMTVVKVVRSARTVRAPVFGRHQFFGTSEHYGKANGSLLSWRMNYNYTASCWFPTSSNILILPSQFWQIGFEGYWLHCSKCRILVFLRYHIDFSVTIFKCHLYDSQFHCFCKIVTNAIITSEIVNFIVLCIVNLILKMKLSTS